MYPNDDPGYALNRLMGTVVRHKNKAILISNVLFQTREKPLLVIGDYILSGEHVEDEIDNFDLTPVTLGWVNYENKISQYFTRMPIRADWRQGFRAFNARYFEIDGRVKKPHQLDFRAIAKTIEGIFPSIDTVIKRLHGAQEGRSMAWCRDFSITSGMEVVYKMYGKVGNFRDGLILLDEKFTWVDESLKEVY